MLKKRKNGEQHQRKSRNFAMGRSRDRTKAIACDERQALSTGAIEMMAMPPPQHISHFLVSQSGIAGKQMNRRRARGKLDALTPAKRTGSQRQEKAKPISLKSLTCCRLWSRGDLAQRYNRGPPSQRRRAATAQSGLTDGGGAGVQVSAS